MTISKLEIDCTSTKSSFLLVNACQKDYIEGVHLGRINHLVLSVSFINGLLVRDDNSSLASILGWLNTVLAVYEYMSFAKL